MLDKNSWISYLICPFYVADKKYLLHEDGVRGKTLGKRGWTTKVWDFGNGAVNNWISSYLSPRTDGWSVSRGLLSLKSPNVFVKPHKKLEFLPPLVVTIKRSREYTWSEKDKHNYIYHMVWKKCGNWIWISCGETKIFCKKKLTIIWCNSNSVK